MSKKRHGGGSKARCGIGFTRGDGHPALTSLGSAENRGEGAGKYLPSLSGYVEGLGAGRRESESR